MAKYVKLGSQALSFADPSTRFKIRQGEVKEYSNVEAVSKKFATALKKGHLEKADQEEFDAWKAGESYSANTEKEESELYTEKSLNKFKKDQLIEMINNDFEDDQETEGLSKPELIELYLDLQGEGSEEEEE